MRSPRDRPSTRGTVTRDNPVVREPAQPDGLEPIKILERVDARLIVYDPSLPFGKRTAVLLPKGATYDEGVKAAWAYRAKKGPKVP